jgi:putative aminopeptidase FrvX
MRTFNSAGLWSAAARLGRFDEAHIVEPPASGASSIVVRRGRLVRPGNLTAYAGPDTLATLSVRARFTGSLVESVARADADSLLAAVQDAAAVPRSTRWLELGAAGAATLSGRPDERRDSLSGAASLLRALADLPGAPGHEWRVREAIRTALPDWARSRLSQDSAGNLILAMGPERDTAVFVAHMDEVGFVVRSIAGDGVVTLASQGGVIPSAWEGQPAVLDFDPRSGAANPQPLHGVFLMRDSASRKQPRVMTAWFALDSAQLAARGVTPGAGVTAYKRATRLAATRFTGRAMDDRVGSAALVLAARALDPAQLDHKVLFVWSVREEGGLVGARALARRIGTSVKRVYAIDTFVSSDTPLESPHFAFTPLGAGPVLRGLDDGLISQRDERGRMLEIARVAGVTLQVGTTHGSTDATPFSSAGAPAMGLSWPGRYSHSPAEVMDLRDLVQLARLIRAAAARN